MKSQVAAEVAAASRRWRAPGWRPARGELLIVAVVDEETGGRLGAEWLTRTHPEKVRCDLLLNEGAGAVFEYGGVRHYGVCCAEKGVFRFTVTTAGVAAHASMPKMGENALLKMAPLLERMAARQPSYALTAEPRAFLERLGEDRGRARAGARPANRGRRPHGSDLRADARRDLRAHPDQGLGEDQRDPELLRGAGRLPRASRPGRGGGQARRSPRSSDPRTVSGSSSPRRCSATARPLDSPLMDAIAGMDRRARPGGADRAGDPAGLHGLAPLQACLSRVRRLRVLPAPAPVDLRDGRARARRRRAHRPAGPGLRERVLQGPGGCRSSAEGGR